MKTPNPASPLDTLPGRYWAWRNSIAGEAAAETARSDRIRLAIVTTHPIQYHSPWFRAMARDPGIDLHVYYCHHAAGAEQGAGFGVAFDWDVPLLDGYRYTFLRNIAATPSLGSFNGLNTPEIAEIIACGAADAVLINGWHYRSAWQAMRACRRHGTPIVARGDSHLHSPRSVLRKALKALPFRAMMSRFDGCAAV